MPNAVGGLSDDEVKRVIDWLNAHWGTEDYCPFHRGPTTWRVSNQLVRADAFGRFPATKALPLVPVICQECGYVAFLASVVVGISVPEGL